MIPILLQMVLHYVIFLDQLLDSFDLLIELKLLFVTLRDQSGQLLLRLVPFFISCVSHLYDLSHILPFLKKLFFKFIVDLFKYGLLFSKIVNTFSHLLIGSDRLIEFLISFLKSVLQNFNLFLILGIRGYLCLTCRF